MEYQTVKTECEQIKKIYNPDEIEVKETYYRCTIKTKVGDFDFLVSHSRIEKPFALGLKDEYDSQKTKEAIKKLKGLK